MNSSCASNIISKKVGNVWHAGGEDIYFRIPLLNQFKFLGFEVGAIGSGTENSFKSHGIKYFSCSLDRGVNPFVDIKSIFQLIGILKRNYIQVVHFFDTKPGLLGPIAARIAGVPVVVRTITGMGFVHSSKGMLAQVLKPIYAILQAIVSRLCDTTIFQNPDDARYFIKHHMVHHNDQKIIISSGIDSSFYNEDCLVKEKILNLRREFGNGQYKLVILVSRIVHEKGIAEYLDAARIVRSSQPEVYFLLVGPRQSERGQAVSADLLQRYSSDVRYLGRRNDVRELLAISDIFVFPTYYREGVPRVLMEAGLMGLPLITTNMPGCREVVRHNWNGLLVPPRSAKELACAIETLLADYDQRRLMGQRSKDFIKQNFELKKVAVAHAELYRNLIKRKMRL